MKKAVAFLIAFLLFLGTAAGIHFLCYDKLDFHNPKFGTWINEKKFYSHEAISANLDMNSVVVFGSSELNHLKKTKYHPEKMFAGQRLNVMMLGAGYYQSLSHAIELSAIEPEMKNNKVVLILSPQWFRPPGVPADAFASRFSEDNFIAMLQNDKLSRKVKQYIITRTEALLVNDPVTLKRVKLYERILWTNDAGLSDRIEYQIDSMFIRERANTGVTAMAYLNGIAHDPKITEAPKLIDWKAYLKDAEQDGKKMTGNNPFYVSNSYYSLHLRPQLLVRKNSGLASSYSTSPEYNDLRAFLDVCRDLNIKPLLVSVPVNGWWYDYTGFSHKDLQQYYENIRSIAKEYGVQLADYSSEEYTPYFLEDTMHLGWKGWVYVDEAIYNYSREN